MSYEPTIWKTGDIVSSEKLNKLENGLASEESRAKSEEIRLEQLFVTPTQEAINSYLDAHPEATTTVQDGAITYEKLSTGLKEKCDDVDNLKADLNRIANNEKVQIDYVLEDGGINASGNEFGESSGTYMRFADYYATADAVDMVFTEKGGALGEYSLFAVYYDANKVFKFRDTTTAGYRINTDYAYFKLSYYNRNGNDEARYRTWITWDGVNKIVDKFSEIDAEIVALKGGNTFAKTGNVITIGTNKAQYQFQRITRDDINIDTWRLYSGNLKTGTGLFNMWLNSDAEGVVKLVGEDDYIGGFHGNEIMTKITAVKDGEVVDLTQDYAEQTFNTLLFYVESDVYHCNTSPDAGVKAFKRNKQLFFEGDKVIVSNDFKAVNNVSVQQAALAFFQCYKDDASNNEILNSYSVNSDFKLYDISDTSEHPTNSKYLTEAIYNLAYGNIVIKITKIDPRFEQYYFSDVSIGTLISQGRLKIYFNTIRNTPSGINMATGDDIFGVFEWEII